MAVPKNVLDKIKAAIRANNSPTGSSRQFITRYLKSEFSYNNANAIKVALKKGVSTKALNQIGQSFLVIGDKIDQVAKPISKENELVIEDLTIGNGEGPVGVGDTVAVDYIGTLDDGTQFDKSKNFEFHVGAGDVIKGWDRGVVGMRVGGTRSLVVGSRLGYGKRGSKPDIPPNATLHFTLLLRKIF
ncbi:hypothetical protein SARC_09982 [Sphaeroforma arctica JP610]|uniref:peptidylprolyl isomerase n=1 Tax=Sphaeroforma arctica JP610 TaxID=667725 RepID=A0A0L0FLB7_9EUKA|nr:hypothetical protein SARC_09982 [Sphaeroforma arctica JP610]KNC77559.1 hypothetical protein SARC_09982 [Sphaeroforma arctica JP610]|eukprot:XP_014151461.1 hypothetical protein SARC_09982 [Sphaeroforma arctica JP610]